MIVQVQPTDKIKLGMVDPIALITLPILVDGHQSIFITHIYIHTYIYICMYIWANYNDLAVLPHWNHG
jgi:hypothetical protein